MLMWQLIILATLACCAALHITGVPLDFTSSDAVLSGISDNIAQKFTDEYIRYLKTGQESATLQQISAQLAEMHSKKDLFTKQLDELSMADQFVACTTCRATVNVMARMFRDEDGEFAGNENDEYLKEIAMGVCERLNLQTPEVCSGLIDFYIPSVKYIVQHSKADARTFCSLFMEFNFCNVKDADYNWTLTVDAGGAAVTGPKSDLPTKRGDELKVLHLTDIHYDPLYVPGALAECDEPQCCQRHVSTTTSDKAAGYWGDYRDCDAPWHMIDDAFSHIKQTHTQLDYIYQTGDVVDHMVWSTSVEKNRDILKKVNNRLAEVFPGVPIYPCIGNHEPHPLNLFSPDDVPQKVNTGWLYEHLYNDWSAWLPADTKDTILKGGYYTVSPKAGFRVIALNNNDCFSENWWLFYEGTNKIPQLQWLHDTLLAAEKAGEYVHILAHIPSGDGTCWSVWAREFNRLVERYRNTISGIFNGHSHKDEMHLHYATNGHAVGVAWNGGALTTSSVKNPNYRIYYMESNSMQVVDSETWMFNLTAANIHGDSKTPDWFKAYEFSAAFTTDLSPAGLDKLLDDMAENANLLRKFWRYKVTAADPQLKTGCDRECLLRTICRIATTVNNQKARCDQLKAKLSKALDEETTTSSSTSKPTTLPTEATTADSGNTTEKPEGDGAASLSSPLINLILAIVMFGILIKM
ncbi:sphingomyelin phosphodiesterase 1-like [Zeugodacus cucurbitae]|uniref:sphingomyelin phosphodiesterase 1-like n=1 Tax=Zeugodacus cucurbitae TaxID=28588 RepID=UPI0010A746FE|nr:sphingomyelin phosphodiesterase 1-like [Zeugodacus cucurbitae]